MDSAKMTTLRSRTSGRASMPRARARVAKSLRSGVVLLSITTASLFTSGMPCVAHAESEDDDSVSQDWPSYNHDRSGSRFNAGETILGPTNVSGLHVKWKLDTPAPVAGTPVVVDNTVYAGDMSGMFYALKSDGTLLWKSQLSGPITASAVVAGDMLVFGDIAGNLYGLKRSSGAVVWHFRPEANLLSAIWGSAIKVGKNVAIGVASNEEDASSNPSCCHTRGSLLLLDPQTGAVVWQTHMISDAQSAAGSSGASIWSTPTYDPSRGLLYVTTGNNFSDPSTDLSDAIVAVDAKTGAIRWKNQRTQGDVWNFTYPNSAAHPDYDFGDSPQVYNLPNGRRVVGAGQKSGFYHVVDASTGELVSQSNQLEPGGSLGGLFADTAVAGGVVFANGINWPSPDDGSYPTAGDLIALSGDGRQELWRFTTPYSPDFGGVAVANSVVYFSSSFPPYGARLFALNATTGQVLASVQIGDSQSGPSISRGQVYVGAGDAFLATFQSGSYPGAIVALGL